MGMLRSDLLMLSAVATHFALPSFPVVVEDLVTRALQSLCPLQERSHKCFIKY